VADKREREGETSRLEKITRMKEEEERLKKERRKWERKMKKGCMQGKRGDA